MRQVFEKLHKYVGKSVEALVSRTDSPHVFRLHKKVRPGRGNVPRGRSVPAAAGRGRRVRSRRACHSPCPRLTVPSQRVYYVREDIMKRAISVRRSLRPPSSAVDACPRRRSLQVARENLVALGVCIGKFTHTSKFLLGVGAIDILAQHAQYKVRGLLGRHALVAGAAPPHDEQHSVFNHTRAVRGC